MTRRLRCVPLASLAALCLLPGCAALGKLAGDEAAAAAPGSTASAPAAPAFRLRIDAPGALKDLLERHLDLARLQQEPPSDALDPQEAGRLASAAPGQVRELLQTEGYFDPRVEVRRGADTPPTITLVIDPGPRTLVQSVQVFQQGPLSLAADGGDAEARALVDRLGRAGPLAPGRPFRNPDWSDTKQQVLARLRAEGYAVASLTGSAADIDADARTAKLSIVVDSGPRFMAGSVRVRGTDHHDEALVRRLAGFDLGAPLTEKVLADYQTQLQQTGLFDAVTVTFDPDPDQAATAQVRVRVVERALQQATVGVGFSNDTGARVTLEHTHRRLFGLPLVAHNKLEVARLRQYWAGDLLTHPGDRFDRWLTGALMERVVDGDQVALSQRLRFGRTQDTPRIERLVFGEWLRSRLSFPEGIRDAQAVSGNLHLVWRDLDSNLLPTRGTSLAVQLGAGHARAADGVQGPFGRTWGRGTWYFPFGQNWYGQARLELGQLHRRGGLEVPDSLLFRAGGDESVRGYAYRSLAPVAPDGVTLVGGHVVGTGSLEVARPIMASMPSVWGAVFVDAGDAAASWSTLKPKVGVGAGVRWRSPIGPLKVDIAYGEATRKFRLHLSVGVVF